MADADRTAPTYVRRAVVALGVERVLAYVDELDLAPRAGAAVLVVAPLRTLRSSRDILTFAQSAPFTAVRAVAEAMSAEELDRVVTLLGDHSANPSFDELAVSVRAAMESGDDAALVATTLAVSASHNVPARDHCLRLLDELPELALPEIDVVTPSRAPREPVDPAIKEARRQRRAADRTARERARSRPPAPNPRSRRPTTRPDAPAPRPVPRVPESARRRAPLTPLEASRFDPVHPLAGYVVSVDVAFEDAASEELAMTGKRRPAIVIAGSDTELLTRPVYSRPGATRRSLVGWNRLGLEHPSFVARDSVVVAVGSDNVPARLGRLSDTEWNSLF